MLDDGIGTQEAPDGALRRLLTASIKRSMKTHAKIAAEMTLHTRQRISKRMVDDWTAGSKKPARFPAAFVVAFCEITGDDRLQRFLMSPRQRELFELGERVSNMGWLLGNMRDEIAKLTGRGRQKKPKRKRTGKL